MIKSYLLRVEELSPYARGMWLGLFAMMLFGLTLPMTRMATGSDQSPQLSPWFVTFGRAAVAACLSIIMLAFTRAPLPERSHWKPLIVASLGNVIGYPLLLAIALRSVSASHAAVITALLPLVTAVVAALTFRQRATSGFWSCAAVGTALVLMYSFARSVQATATFHLDWADLLLVVAVLAASVGYVQGAQITPKLGADRVICWVTIVSLPVSLPGAILTWPNIPVSTSAWTGFAYVGTFSMWLALFAWYRALAVGGAIRVSQVQLLQPFFAMLFAVPLLSETLDMLTLGFGAAVVTTVYIGKRMSTPT